MCTRFEVRENVRPVPSAVKCAPDNKRGKMIVRCQAREKLRRVPPSAGKWSSGVERGKLVSLRNRTAEGRGRWNIVVWPTWHLSTFTFLGDFRLKLVFSHLWQPENHQRYECYNLESWILGRHVGHTRTICRPTTSAVLLRKLRRQAREIKVWNKCPWCKAWCQMRENLYLVTGARKYVQFQAQYFSYEW